VKSSSDVENLILYLLLFMSISNKMNAIRMYNCKYKGHTQNNRLVNTFYNPSSQL